MKIFSSMLLPEGSAEMKNLCIEPRRFILLLGLAVTVIFLASPVPELTIANSRLWL